jgi:hypothetical protein
MLCGGTQIKKAERDAVRRAYDAAYQNRATSAGQYIPIPQTIGSTTWTYVVIERQAAAAASTVGGCKLQAVGRSKCTVLCTLSEVRNSRVAFRFSHFLVFLF